MGKIETLQPLFLLSDEPIGSHAQNAFTDDPFARTVASAALGTTGPFTIGVYGGWGSGKTSALHAARTMIDADPMWSHVVTVEFNAWRYEREAHPIVPLVATIEREVAAKAATLGKKDPAKHADQIAWYKKAGMQCRAFLAGWQFKLKPEIGVPLVGKVGAEATWTAKDSLQRYTELQKELNALDGEHWSSLRDSCLSLSVFDALDAVGDAVGNAAGDAKADWPLVVVFIDDLDRCQADKAFELLENVKLVLCQLGFVFVLALNHAVVDGYLSYRAEKLYGKDNYKLHKSYLEKIVQLPLAMPSRSERFTDFATHLLDKRLSQKAEPELRNGLKKLAKVLALSANRTPRSLVRRINTALIDIALRDPTMLPDTLKKEASPFPHFSGLCIVQRTLEAAIGMDSTRALAQDNALCEVIAKGNIWAIDDAIKAAREGDTARRAADAHPRVPVVGDVLGERAESVGAEPPTQDPQSVRGWRELFNAVYEATFLWWEDQDAAGNPIAGTSVLTSPEGKRWLTKHEERRAVMRITVQRPEAESSTPEVEKDSGESNAPPAPLESKPPSLGGPQRELTAPERAIIDKAIRQHLKLPADAPIGPAEFLHVTELYFIGSPITDAGAAWLADPEAVFASLRILSLGSTHVTDEGVKALSRAETGLKSLTTLDLHSTDITDAGLKELARADTGVQHLTTLHLSGTDVTDFGLKDLARESTGLQELTTLSLGNTDVTDGGLKLLARANTGLRALATLDVYNTDVTDAGLKVLACAETGLKSLTVLSLAYTRVTDAGVKELLGAEAGLKLLTKLILTGTKVTQAGVAAVKRRWPEIEVIL